MEEQGERHHLAIFLADQRFARGVLAEQAVVQHGFFGDHHVFEFFKHGQFMDHAEDGGHVGFLGGTDGEGGRGAHVAFADGVVEMEATAAVLRAPEVRAQATLDRHSSMPTHSMGAGR